MTQVDVPSSLALPRDLNERIHTLTFATISQLCGTPAHHIRRCVGTLSDRVYCHVRRRIPIKFNPVETLVLVIP